MAADKASENDVSLPFSALQLLAPSVRLVSAALLKVLRQRDALEYGTVEEFVTSVCETVPGLLTFRHQGKLALGLRGRFILELFQRDVDPAVIVRHLERFRAPAASSAQPKDIKIERTVHNFRELVQTFLSDTAERGQFFKEEFTAEYGSNFDQELEKLLWEFLTRLDQLLPVPNLAQTVSWLSAAPPVLEECARAASQLPLLKILLQHETCLGHLESAASLPPNMGDSILTSLSLPLSGRLPISQPTGSSKTSGDGQTQTGDTSFIEPVIALISSEDVPVMIMADKKKARGDQMTTSQDCIGDTTEPVENSNSSPKKWRHGSVKRKRPENNDTDSEKEEEIARGAKNGRERLKRVKKGVGHLKRGGKAWRESRGQVENKDGGSDQEVPSSCAAQSSTDGPTLPKGPSVLPVLKLGPLNQPRVLISRLDMASVSVNAKKTATDPPQGQIKDEKRESPIATCTKTLMDDQRRLVLELTRLDNKKICPVVPGKTGSRAIPDTSSLLTDSEDFVGDSEDEATKNFKVRLFGKRYYRTKHDTYVPTLREFWKPWMERRNLLSPVNGHR